MYHRLNAINLLIFFLVGEIAHAVVPPLPTNDDPNVLASLPQITQAPAPVFLRAAITGRQATIWNTCDGYSWQGAVGDAASVSCVAPYTCLVGVHSVYPYWGCELPTTSALWYTACVPYSARASFFSSSIAYW
jgi:hypothetical protein